MKIAHTADWHIYNRHLYGKSGQGMSRGQHRLSEIERNANSILDECYRRKVFYLIVCGDVFHNSHPNDEELRTFSRILSRAVDNGIKIRFLIGDHDTNGSHHSMEGVRNIVSRYKEDHIKIFDNKCTEETHLNGVTVFYLPWSKSVHSNIKALNSMKILKNRRETFNIIATHVDISGVRLPSGYKAKGTGISSRDFSHFDLALLGDYHDAMSIGSKIYYAGSIIRISWSERMKHKSFYIHDIVKDIHECIKLPEIDMYELDLSELELARYCTPSTKLINGRSIRDSVIRLLLHSKSKHPEQLGLFREILNKNHVRDFSARVILEKQNKVLVQNYKQGINIETYWRKFCKQKNVDEEIVEYGLNILSKC